jgi:DNA invertase Pin-like site-specific DNA recombinase
MIRAALQTCLTVMVLLASAIESSAAGCKASNSILIIAKLDRLSRNASFLLNLQDSGVKFICADMPEADHTMIGVMAVIAQREGEAISKRTKEALAAAKARGVQLGAYRDGVYVGGKGNADTARNAREARTARLRSIERERSYQ